MTAPLPANEAARLQAVLALNVFGTLPEPQFDDLALIASRVCGTPIALVSLMGEREQWFKAHVGIEVCSSSRDVAFCSHAILQDGMFVVPDALLDERFADNPLVIGPPFVRFYAGVPLIDARGFALGTLCVIDTEPHPTPFTTGQAEALWALSRQVVTQLELRTIAAENERLCRAAQRTAADRAHEATHDALTGLPNRVNFAGHVAAAVESARQSTGVVGTIGLPAPERSAVFFIDLDGFKLVNDSLGHAAGDELLRQVAARLLASVRSAPRRRDPVGKDQRPVPPDTVARLGGDEFTIVLRNLRQPDDARIVAERLLASLARPFELAGRPVRIGGSIGIAHVDGHHDNADDAMREADTAMYHAKLRGKAQHTTFDAAMREAALDRIQLEADLRSTIAEGGSDLRLFYQPVVALETDITVGFEALVRWQHPTRGLLNPSQFVPMAEETNLIDGLGSWVIDEGCRQLAEWTAQDERLSDLSLNINVARKQLINPSLIPNLRRALANSGIAPARLKLEITESSIMKDPTQAAEVMRRLRQLGVELYMDDFGTGHSSLSCLHQFPLDGLKIDRSFIATLTERRDYAAIVHAVMNLARNFKMRVTAEGIETLEQVQLLQMLDCELGQGYYFAKPLPPEEAIARVLDRRPSYELVA